MKNNNNGAPNFQYPNNVNQNNQPIGYPDMSGRDPQSYPKLNPPPRVIKYQSGTLSHSVNKEPTLASMAELKQMKLAK